MKIHIFDVEHGECSIIETPTGHTILIGAGHNSSTQWRPSDWLKAKGLPLTKVVLNHLDEDHLSDLHSFEPHYRPAYIVRNYDHDTQLVVQEKQLGGGAGKGLITANHWANNVFTGARVNLDLGLETKYFWHHPSKFSDTNNLSVVTFVFYNNIGIIFPGDVEKAGWEEFLKIPDFAMCLSKVTVFVASHHGRINGYSDQVFGFCKPEIIVISDKPIEHDTQTHSSYAQHAKGINFDGVVRKVLTTRQDGKLTIEILPTGQATIYKNQPYG